MTGMDSVSPGADGRLDEAVDELYGTPLEEFLPSRARLVAAAKADGDTDAAAAIKTLRKPTAAAWAVNLMARKRPDDLDRLADLAAELRDAQERLDGARMTALARSRTALVDELVATLATVVAEAGGRLTAAAARDAGATFVAALASPSATEAVVSGRLTRALEYAGFGDVDIRDATARPLRLVPTGPMSGPSVRSAGPTGSAASGTAARSGTATPPDTTAPTRSPELADAEAALHTAMSAATAATARCGVLAAEAELAHTRVASLQKELVRARAHRDATDDALAAAEVAREEADAALAAARVTLERLRAAPDA